MSGQLLIVDGHNALLGLARFAERHRENGTLAREQLIDWLSRYQSASEDAVVVVFDGRGAQRDVQQGDEGEVMVIYARARESADAVVEQLAASQAKKRRVLVASNDRSIQYAVANGGADFMTLGALELRVEGQLGSWRRHWRIQS
ncbi:NYN domain-containing protein [Roseibacillus ishigakijimensis]|uniref:NYN domain-containing protein n=1 Tax=Roseibacillus ishigakijimensis TaxID=454146 RepID=A0A934VHR4_9BACT|nr:NYN domain-containing protein [Roseibacillus ishigakijimensis]MBK1834258.1 NYN domain-containing protein [Roseibacillus ishigakijimensis]